ncbi:diacylglycerol O-acyltransferase 1 [Nematocida displodere]|uniref:diacylglycerol O-acyltransferase n=1 Tax=Nematocida displodere TaxID=1805483 RepID=A0A177ELR1_9MICR|nr:diacylglycerol O-acyltransferase 1 [Nematocida displodere]
MDRVHSRCVHLKRRGLFESAELGEGGKIWIVVAFAVFTYKSLFNPAYRGVGEQILAQVKQDLDLSSVAAMGAVNTLRWIVGYFVAHNTLSQPILFGMLGVSVGLEAVFYAYPMNGFTGAIFRYLSITQLMKLISYLFVTRESALMGWDDVKIEEPTRTPSLARFIAYPTLCYQLKFPTTTKVNFRRMLLYTLMLVPLATLSFFSLQMQSGKLARQMLKTPSFGNYVDLVVWTNVGWLSGFGFVFIAVYGIQSELTRFGDQTFFGSWWDSTIPEYWRKWNTQVHVWVKRHIYIALLKRNITKKSSKLMIFLVSGLVHEYIISNAIGRKGVGILTMSMQVPLDYITKFIEKKTRIDAKLPSMVILNLIGAPLVAMASQWYWRPVLGHGAV